MSLRFLLSFIFTFVVLGGFNLFAQSLESSNDEDADHFAGRISRINQTARLMRVKTDFTNIKYLNKNDQLDFWNESYPLQKCPAFVESKSHDYLLLRIPQFDQCIRKVHFTTGSYLHFKSLDLAENLKIGKELTKILLKKRAAMESKKNHHHQQLKGHIEKVEAVNKRFEILKQKLEIEWSKELTLLEEDRTRSFSEFKDAEARLNEIDTKLEAYRAEDYNLKLDRWSLDPALYIKK
jgi:hypothetical protein